MFQKIGKCLGYFGEAIKIRQKFMFKFPDGIRKQVIKNCLFIIMLDSSKHAIIRITLFFVIQGWK